MKLSPPPLRRFLCFTLAIIVTGVAAAGAPHPLSAPPESQHSAGGTTDFSATSPEEQPVAPSFIKMPADQSVVYGRFATCAFETLGSRPQVYALIRDNEVIKEATYPSYFFIGPVNFENAGTYQIRATNDWGEATSDPFTIQIDPGPPPLAFRMDRNTEVAAGKTFQLKMSSITGNPPFSFQWFKDGHLIPGATESSYSKTNATIADAASYHLEVSNLAGTFRSLPIGVSVSYLQPPKIHWATGDSTAFFTGSDEDEITLKVTATDSGDFTYTWHHDGILLPDATGASLRLAPLKLADAGEYTVTVNNEAGSSPARTIQLEVIDRSNTAPVITRHPTSTEIQQGEGTDLTIEWDGYGTVQWYLNNSPLSGATSATLPLRVVPQLLEGSKLAIPGPYHAVVSRGTGTSVSHPAELVIHPFPTGMPYNRGLPNILAQPRAVSLLPGTTAELEIELEFYSSHNKRRWFMDGVLIEDERQTTLQVSEAGVYQLELSDYSGNTVTTDPITVTVDPEGEQPVFRVVPGDRKIRFNRDTYIHFSLSVPVVDARWERNGEPYSATGVSLWRSDRSGPEADGTYRLIVTTADGEFISPPVEVSRLTDGLAPYLSLHPTPQTLDQGSYLYLEATAVGESPMTYQWQLNGEDIPGANSPTYGIGNLSANNAGDYTVIVTNENGSATSTPAPVAVIPVGAPTITRHPASLQISSSMSSVPALTVEVESIRGLQYEWFRNGESLTTSSDKYFFLKDWGLDDISGAYHVVATNPAGTVTSHTATVSVLPAPEKNLLPDIIAHPLDAAIAFGDSKVLTASVSSPTPMQFQWRHNGVDIPGATQLTHTVNLQSTDDVGLYSLIVSNDHGVASTQAARVTLALPDRPLITGFARPSAPLPLGSTAQFSVEAIAATDLSYQWRKDGVLLPDADAASLTLTELSATDAGVYSVEITSAAGRVASRSFLLRVAPGDGQAIGTHRVLRRGWDTQRRVTIKNQVLLGSGIDTLTWEALLPEGWSLISSDSTADSAPADATTSLAGWTWNAPAANSLTFTYVLQAPLDQTDFSELSAMISWTSDGTPTEFLIQPDPLRLGPPPSRHSADTDANGRLELSELLRVIELYNTRHGTSRTGRYRENHDSTDGFETDLLTPAIDPTALVHYHLADTDEDGTLSLSELLRVIELYNTRSGTTRTGAYHPDATTEDGFAPGPN
ncbi:immunoglobulin domain-containing protein [Actomonas aquatica]|uniref:Ig-like domain-containing protein n=1 Tax=Actomonas aquatica TaxID=2866162 RepID=A0ABZ1C3B8_9BACT|nr:immunoglobulin domain-containing protein [Opitutus sp. WL0086]WRQ86201.1 hypothetical protein K1X11_015405 [Opitutus sp. WL0086]